MTHQKSLKNNYIYNVIMTSLNIIFPLITAPYLSFILGAENIGKVNFATSIISWFILVASFGIPRYGMREIARNRESRDVLTNSFWNLISIQAIISGIAVIAYLIMIFQINRFKTDNLLYIFMVITIILNIFSIDWFYQGIEEYGYITVRNIGVKMISIFLIFMVIKRREDFVLYAVINIFALGFNNVLNYFHAYKFIHKIKLDLRPIHYIKELRIYFLTTIVIAIYTSLDQTFIGAISEKDLAYYVRSKIILGIGLNITNSIVTILIPRLAYLIVKSYDEYKKMLESSLNYLYLLAIPCTTGIFLLAKEITLFLGGVEFLPAATLLQVTSLLVIINSIGGWQVNQILIPHKFEKAAFYLQCTGAIFSVVFNIVLIPRFTYLGAGMTWLFTEIYLMLAEGIFIKFKCRRINIHYFNSSLFKYIGSAITMGIYIVCIKRFELPMILNLLVCIAGAPVIYLSSILLLRDKLVAQVVKQILVKVRCY